MKMTEQHAFDAENLNMHFTVGANTELNLY